MGCRHQVLWVSPFKANFWLVVRRAFIGSSSDKFLRLNDFLKPVSASSFDGVVLGLVTLVHIIAGPRY